MPEQGASYTFEDLSGSSANTNPITDPNPYNVLIHACDDSAAAIAERYQTHRITRALQQRTTLLSSAFPGPSVDPILRRLSFTHEPDYEDTRNCLVLWARPPTRIRSLIATIQARLKAILPNFWLMPPDNLHLTALEFAHSRTPEDIEGLLKRLDPLIETATDLLYTQRESKRARLVKPMLTYDAAAVALSFLPAVEGDDDAMGAEQTLGEKAMDLFRTVTGQSTEAEEHHHRTSTEQTHFLETGDVPTSPINDIANRPYTYHHVRRDLWDLCSENSSQNTHSTDSPKPGVPIASRYTVPSAHLTIARFVTAIDVTVDGTEEGAINMDKIEKFVEEIEGVNRWLESELWSTDEGEWTIGEEKGLDCRAGSLWYGGGRTVKLGQGF